VLVLLFGVMLRATCRKQAYESVKDSRCPRNVQAQCVLKGGQQDLSALCAAAAAMQPTLLVVKGMV
jgi:hypothetical protein